MTTLRKLGHLELRLVRHRWAVTAAWVVSSLFLVNCISEPDSSPQPVRLATVDLAGSVSLDGKFLSFVDWSTGAIGVRDLQTDEVRSLSPGWGSDDFAYTSRVSPDGSLIAVTFYSGAAFQLRLVAMDGSRESVLYERDDVRLMEPVAWFPDGEHLLAIAQTHGGRWRLVELSLEGSIRELREFLPEDEPGGFAVLPDGDYIAYHRQSHDASRGRDLFLASVRDGSEHSLLARPEEDRLMGIAPGGDFLLLATDRGGYQDISLLDIGADFPAGSAPGEPRQLAAALAEDPQPLALAENGDFYFATSTRRTAAYLVPLDDLSRQSGDPARWSEGALSVAWAPSGDRLATVRASGYGYETEIRGVTDGEGRVLPLDLSDAGGFRAQWLRDGKALMVHARDSQARLGIFRVDVATGAVSALARTREVFNANDGALDHPVPTVRGLAFVREEEGVETVVARDLSTGEERTLFRDPATLGLYGLAASHDAQTLAYCQVRLVDGLPRSRLLTMPLSGGDPHLVLETVLPEQVRTPAWLPDDSGLIAGVATRGEPGFRLVRVALTGSLPEALGVEVADQHLLELAVAPGGRYLAFLAGTPPAKDVWVVRRMAPGSVRRGD